MTPQPDFDLIAFIKDWILVPALGLVGFAWNHNQKEHDMIKQEHKELRDSTSSGHSVLNDRIMEHIDARVDGVREEHEKRIDRVNDHITRLFQNAEADRASFRDALTDISNAGNNRHLELLKGQNEILVSMHQALAQKADK